MQRLSIGILIAVGVFVVLVAGTLVMRSRSTPVEATGPAVSKADYRIKEVRLEEETGKVRWRLVAEQAEIFEVEGRTGLKSPVVDIREATRSWRVRGDEGDVHQKTKDLEVRRNVVLESDDGLRLETSVLRWEARAQRLWTDAPVTIIRDGSVIRGNGLDVHMEQERAAVRGRVHAAFTRPSRVVR
jgi:LPS export ABC transporter protein LptC